MGNSNSEWIILALRTGDTSPFERMVNNSERIGQVVGMDPFFFLNRLAKPFERMDI